MPSMRSKVRRFSFFRQHPSETDKICVLFHKYTNCILCAAFSAALSGKGAPGMNILSLPVSLKNVGLALLRHPLRKRKTLPPCGPPAPKLILWPPPRRDRRCSRAARRSSGRTAVPSPPGRAGRLCRRPAGGCRRGGPSLLTAKYCHRAVFAISGQQRCWGLGLSSVMRDALLSAARSMGYTQLELEVDARNGCGLALYQKFGFPPTVPAPRPPATAVPPCPPTWWSVTCDAPTLPHRFKKERADRSASSLF